MGGLRGGFGKARQGVGLSGGYAIGVDVSVFCCVVSKDIDFFRMNKK